MNSKQNFRRSFFLSPVLILSLLLFACGGEPPAPTLQVNQTTQASPAQTASSQTAFTQTAPTSTSSDSQPTATLEATSYSSTGAALSSYRIHAEWRTGGSDGPVEQEWNIDYAADPLAFHQKVKGEVEMETIVIGTTYWTRLMEMSWRKVELSSEELKDWDKMLSQPESPVQVDELTPLDNSIQWLTGQPHINIAEGSLTEVGTEMINGVNCKRYKVDSTYNYNVTYQSQLSGSAEITEQHQGEVWLADQDGWPTFVVRARLLEITTTQVEGGASSTVTQWLEEDVTDINSPDIVIQAPE